VRIGITADVKHLLEEPQQLNKGITFEISRNNHRSRRGIRSTI